MTSYIQIHSQLRGSVQWSCTFVCKYNREWGKSTLTSFRNSPQVLLCILSRDPDNDVTQKYFTDPKPWISFVFFSGSHLILKLLQAYSGSLKVADSNGVSTSATRIGLNSVLAAKNRSWCNHSLRSELYDLWKTNGCLVSLHKKVSQCSYEDGAKCWTVCVTWFIQH